MNPGSLTISSGTAWGQPHISNLAHTLLGPTQSCPPPSPGLLGPCQVLIFTTFFHPCLNSRPNSERGLGAAASPRKASRGRAAWSSPGPQRRAAQDPAEPCWTTWTAGGLGSQREPRRLRLLAWDLESRGRSGVPGDGGPCASQMHLCHLLASGSHCTCGEVATPYGLWGFLLTFLPGKSQAALVTACRCVSFQYSNISGLLNTVFNLVVSYEFRLMS